MLLYRPWILCSLSFQSEIERKFSKFVILSFQMWLKDQTLVHHSKQTEMIALTRCSCSKISIIRFVAKDTWIIFFFNQPLLSGFLQQKTEEMEKPHKNMFERSDIKGIAADHKGKTFNWAMLIVKENKSWKKKIAIHCQVLLCVNLHQ